MGNNCRMCKSYSNCNCHVIFRIVTLFVLILGTVLQGIAIYPKTAWDRYETVLHYKYVTQPVEISAYQTLFDVVPVKSVPKSQTLYLPPVYPIEKADLNVAWKEIIVTYETTSIGLATVCILICENALLIHVIKLDNKFTRIFQPAMLITVILTSIGAGILSMVGALEYQDNYQKVLLFNNLDKVSPLVKNVYKEMKRINFDYNASENVVSTGFYLVMTSGALFCLTSALTIGILITYCIVRSGKNKTTPVENTT